MATLVAEELTNNLSNVPNYEYVFNEGDTGELRVYVGLEPAPGMTDYITQQILAQGAVLLEPVVYDAGMLIIKFQKAIAPLLIIAGAVTSLIAGILGWQIFQTTQYGLPLWVWFVGGAAILWLFLSSDKGKEAGGTLIKASKVYVTKKLAGNPSRRRLKSGY